MCNQRAHRSWGFCSCDVSLPTFQTHYMRTGSVAFSLSDDAENLFASESSWPRQRSVRHDSGRPASENYERTIIRSSNQETDKKASHLYFPLPPKIHACEPRATEKWFASTT